MGDATMCVLEAFLTIRVELQLVILENTTGKWELTLYIIMTVTIGLYFFQIYTFGQKYIVTVNLAICAIAGSWMVY